MYHMKIYRRFFTVKSGLILVYMVWIMNLVGLIQVLQLGNITPQSFISLEVFLLKMYKVSHILKLVKTLITSKYNLL